MEAELESLRLQLAALAAVEHIALPAQGDEDGAFSCDQQPPAVVQQLMQQQAKLLDVLHLLATQLWAARQQQPRSASSEPPELPAAAGGAADPEQLQVQVQALLQERHMLKKRCAKAHKLMLAQLREAHEQRDAASR